MALNFPVSPSLNQTYTVGSKTWKWNGSAWDLNVVTGTTTDDTARQAAYDAANTATAAYSQANTGTILAQEAFNRANTKVSSSGGTITGNLVVDGDLTATGNVNFTGNVTNVTITGNTGQFFGDAANGFQALYAGIPTGYTFQEQTVVQSTGNYDGFIQINLQNINSGQNASTDFVATNDNPAGDAYIDIGINSTTYNDPTYELQHAGDGYVYVRANTETGGGNLVFSTTETGRDIVISTGGTTHTNEMARFKDGVGLVMYSKPIKFADGTSQNTAFLGFGVDNVARYTANSGSLYANGAFLQANTGVTNALAASTYANGAFLQANTGVTNALAASTYANAAFTQANTGVTNAATADSKAVSAGSYANSAYTQANTATSNALAASNSANAAFGQANTGVTNAATADGKAVTAGNYANSAFSVANTAINNASGASLYANAAFTQANTGVTNASTADSKAVTAGNYANSAFGIANSAFENAAAASLYANSAFTAANNAGSSAAVVAAFLQANAAFIQANAAYAQANTGGGAGTDEWARGQANAAFIQANAAFAQANTGGASSGNSTFVTRNYTGDGTTTGYTVTANTNVDNVIVTENGVVQTPTTDYTISSTTLTFTTAPVSGVKIQIREIGASQDPFARTQANNAYAKANTGTTLGKSIAMTIVFGG